MKRVMFYIAKELTDEANELAIEESGYHKVGAKVREIIELLHSDIEVKEDTTGSGFVAWDKCEMFENRIGIEQMRCSYKTDSYGSDRKSRNQEEIGNGFIKIIYTHLIPNPDRDSTKKYKTQNITVLIPAIEAENYEVLEKCMPQAIRSNCSSLIETLEKNYKNKNIKTLLLHNKLQDGFPEDGTPNNNKSIKKL